MRRFIRAGALAVSLLLVWAVPASAAESPYSEDPIGLVPFRDTVHRVYSGGQDVWEVWVCDIPGWSTPLDVDTVTADLNGIISPYYLWLSAGRYQPAFKAGGYVASNDFVSTDNTRVFLPKLTGCEDAVKASSTSLPEGVLIIADGGFGEGYGNPGFSCPPPFSGCASTYPENQRSVVLGAGSVAVVPPFAQARYEAVAHEIGHAISWAHSYGGRVVDRLGNVNEYDNIVDVMSGYELRGLPVGTHAYNRYAAGWIDPTEVAIYTSGTFTYRLEQIGGQGLEMVAIPLSTGYLYGLGLRTQVSWDQTLAKNGVEAYLIDSRTGSCTPWSGWPLNYPCFGASTRVSPSPAPSTTTDTSHVHGVDETFTLGPWSLKVLQDDLGRTYLRITDGNYVGRFVDDDGNFHEANIEAIAAAGLTQGCDPPANDRYCPTQLLSRAAMATFIVRALGLESQLPPYQGTFRDVPAGEWFTPYVEKLYQLGITVGYSDGTFQPNGIVSRAELAVFLSRALGLDVSVAPEGVFTDVPVDAWFVAQAEALFRAGITAGCTAAPRQYCPNNPVPRDQMATFLARAILQQP